MVDFSTPNATTNCDTCGIGLLIGQSIRLRGGIVVCADAMLCSTLTYIKKRDTVSEETKNNGGPFIRKAKVLVAETYNAIPVLGDATPEDFYVVWFVKVLGNWKALVSTDIVDGLYWEVTYDGVKKQSYVDTYSKMHNQAITDAGYALLDPSA